MIRTPVFMYIYVHAHKTHVHTPHPIYSQLPSFLAAICTALQTSPNHRPSDPTAILPITSRTDEAVGLTRASTLSMPSLTHPLS
mmetsp:Transcript_15877/g.45239  ORF Transcript_15877/g.45239 Transcript_15877/m.45239 type:complete len:84 (+) Transcript_15877:426-677(+)